MDWWSVKEQEQETKKKTTSTIEGYKQSDQIMIYMMEIKSSIQGTIHPNQPQVLLLLLLLLKSIPS